jgi:hypothetical protein
MAHGNVRRSAWQSTESARVLALFLMAGLLLTAGRSGHADTLPGLWLKILNTSSPPGGTMQIAVTVTEPKPISTGSAVLTLNTAVLGPVMGVALYGPAGAQSDAAGAAVVSGNTLRVRTVSPSSAFGTSTAVPILAVTMGVRADALPGAQATLLLDPAASFWVDPAGLLYPQDVRNGTFRVAGTVSIHDVFPGTGLLPAGSTVVVRGMGFQPGAAVEIDGVPLASAAVVSATELDATIAVSADMYGRRVRVRNPDLSYASYFAYLRAAWLGRSAQTLLADTDPIFSPQVFTGAFFKASAAAGQFFGLALQNPAAAPADVTIELRSSAAGTIASAALTLPARTRISREASELFAGRSLPAGGFLVVRSTSPVQMLGLLGDEAARTVEPIPACLAFP